MFSTFQTQTLIQKAKKWRAKVRFIICVSIRIPFQGIFLPTFDFCIAEGEKSASLFAFLHVELTRGYLLEHDEERFSARREKVYSFIKIPQELEKFMAYGFFQCADSLLFVYTFLPLRFMMAFWSFFTRLFRKCFG